jgi:hypothetical protein
MLLPLSLSVQDVLVGKLYLRDDLLLNPVFFLLCVCVCWVGGISFRFCGKLLNFSLDISLGRE